MPPNGQLSLMKKGLEVECQDTKRGVMFSQKRQNDNDDDDGRRSTQQKIILRCSVVVVAAVVVLLYFVLKVITLTNINITLNN